MALWGLIPDVARELRLLRQQIIITGGNVMATVQEELQQTRASLDRYKAFVGSRIQNLQDEVKMLKDSLANAGTLSPEDQSTFDSMQAELDALSSETPPVEPAEQPKEPPVEPPNEPEPKPAEPPADQPVTASSFDREAPSTMGLRRR